MEPRIENLRCELTTPELLQRGDEAARLQEEAGELAEALAAHNKAEKATISDLESSRNYLLREIRQRATHRDVKVVDAVNEAEGTMETTRTDTGDVFRSRPLTEEEKQRSMFPREAGEPAA